MRAPMGPRGRALDHSVLEVELGQVARRVGEALVGDGVGAAQLAAILQTAASTPSRGAYPTC